MSGNRYSEIKVPPLGESIQEATVARWLKAAGDFVKMDETLVELETDKVTLEVNAPASGILKEVRIGQGETTSVGSLLGIIEAAEASAAPAAASPATVGDVMVDGEIAAETISKAKTLPQKIAEPSPPPFKAAPFKMSSLKTSFSSSPPPRQKLATPPQKAEESRQFAPSVRKMAEEMAINPHEVVGTGPGGRVTKGDMLAYTEEKPLAPVADTKPFGYDNIPEYGGERKEERIKMTRLRQRIAERLKQAQNTAAILTTFNEVDMAAITALRAKYKEPFEKKHGVRLGFMSFFVKACVQALKEMPLVNAEISEDEVIYKNYYDIGVAVSTPQGLVVPIVRDADLLGFADLEKAIAGLGQKAREGKLSMAEITGGTFTISNGGVFGSLLSTPILNPPQSAILGMHKIQDRPMVVDGKIEIRPMMYLALSYDHRIIDGRESVSFLGRIKESLENPERLLLDM